MADISVVAPSLGTLMLSLIVLWIAAKWRPSCFNCFVGLRIAAASLGWAGGRVSVQMESDKLLPVTELASPGDPRCRSNTAPRGNINTENIIAV